MAPTTAGNVQHLPLPQLQTPPSIRRLGIPETPQAPKRVGNTEVKQDAKSNPTLGPRRRLFLTPLRDRAAQLQLAPDPLIGQHVPIPSPNRHALPDLPLRPIRSCGAERTGGSQGRLQDTGHWGSLGVRSSSSRMQNNSSVELAPPTSWRKRLGLAIISVMKHYV